MVKYDNFEFKIKMIVWWDMFRRKWVPFGKLLTEELYATIGYYYHDKHSPDREMIEKSINMMQITRVWYSYGYVYIESKRPGLLIGKAGSDLNDMTKYFKSNWKHGFPFRGIRLKSAEDDSQRYMFLWQYRYSDWDG